jgi:hypothetical protein
LVSFKGRGLTVLLQTSIAVHQLRNLVVPLQHLFLYQPGNVIVGQQFLLACLLAALHTVLLEKLKHLGQVFLHRHDVAADLLLQAGLHLHVCARLSSLDRVRGLVRRRLLALLLGLHFCPALFLLARQLVQIQVVP